MPGSPAVTKAPRERADAPSSTRLVARSPRRYEIRERPELEQRAALAGAAADQLIVGGRVVDPGYVERHPPVAGAEHVPVEAAASLVASTLASVHERVAAVGLKPPGEDDIGRLGVGTAGEQAADRQRAADGAEVVEPAQVGFSGEAEAPLLDA